MHAQKKTHAYMYACICICRCVCVCVRVCDKITNYSPTNFPRTCRGGAPLLSSVEEEALLSHQLPSNSSLTDSGFSPEMHSLTHFHLLIVHTLLSLSLFLPRDALPPTWCVLCVCVFVCFVWCVCVCVCGVWCVPQPVSFSSYPLSLLSFLRPHSVILSQVPP